MFYDRFVRVNKENASVSTQFLQILCVLLMYINVTMWELYSPLSCSCSLHGRSSAHIFSLVIKLRLSFGTLWEWEVSHRLLLIFTCIRFEFPRKPEMVLRRAARECSTTTAVPGPGPGWSQLTKMYHFIIIRLQSGFVHSRARPRSGTGIRKMPASAQCFTDK